MTKNHYNAAWPITNPSPAARKLEASRLHYDKQA